MISIQAPAFLVDIIHNLIADYYNAPWYAPVIKNL